MNISPIDRAIRLVGCKTIADACGPDRQSVYQWKWANSMPGSDRKGLTNYAEIIENLTEGEVTKADLLGKSGVD